MDAAEGCRKVLWAGEKERAVAGARTWVTVVTAGKAGSAVLG